MTVDIVALTRDNTGLLSNIAAGVFDNPPAQPHIDHYLADPSQTLLLALKDGLVVGQLKAALHRHPDKAPNLYVEELGVADDHLRQGIGRALLSKAEGLAQTLGCAELWLATEPENAAANALYRAAGWQGQHVVMYSRLL